MTEHILDYCVPMSGVQKRNGPFSLTNRALEVQMFRVCVSYVALEELALPESARETYEATASLPCKCLVLSIFFSADCSSL